MRFKQLLTGSLLGLAAIGLGAGLLPVIAQQSQPPATVPMQKTTPRPFSRQIQQWNVPAQTQMQAPIMPTTPAPANNVIIILDASDSMNGRLGGVSKMDSAKQTVINTLNNLPPNVKVGLRVYGHRFYGNNFFNTHDAQNCQQTELIIPLGFNNRQQITQRVHGIEAIGRTPISLALQRSISQDFMGQPGPNTIILVSDGRETCDRDPCDVAIAMAQSGVKVKINAIGLGLKDYVAQDQLKCVAAATKGKYYDAQTAAQLAEGIQESITNVNARIVPGR